MRDWRREFKRLEGAYAPATIKSYFVDFGIFAEWCEANGLAPLPASQAAIVSFLEAQAPDKAVATLDRRLYSIRRSILTKMPMSRFFTATARAKKHGRSV